MNCFYKTMSISLQKNLIFVKLKTLWKVSTQWTVWILDMWNSRDLQYMYLIYRYIVNLLIKETF